MSDTVKDKVTTLSIICLPRCDGQADRWLCAASGTHRRHEQSPLLLARLFGRGHQLLDGQLVRVEREVPARLALVPDRRAYQLQSSAHRLAPRRQRLWWTSPQTVRRRCELSNTPSGARLNNSRGKQANISAEFILCLFSLSLITTSLAEIRLSTTHKSLQRPL